MASIKELTSNFTKLDKFVGVRLSTLAKENDPSHYFERGLRVKYPQTEGGRK